MHFKLKTKLPADRTYEQIKNHYLVEKAIAEKLKQSDREERKEIFATMYDTLFELVPDHPRLAVRESDELTIKKNKYRWRLIGDHVDGSMVCVEFAPGDCRFAFELCRRAKFVYGVDISDQTGGATVPDNFSLITYDGYHLPLDEGMANVVFSDQLIEHFHPEDTEFHFGLARKILVKRGKYLIRTPHRYNGPSDVSKYFSYEPECFHLKEWTYCELMALLKDGGWTSCYGYWSKRGIRFRAPKLYFVVFETILGKFPKRLRKLVSRYLLPSNIEMVAIK